jgi:hypothetical protein
VRSPTAYKRPRSTRPHLPDTRALPARSASLASAAREGGASGLGAARRTRRTGPDQIVAETRGNPLALLELPRGFDRGGAGGGFGLPGAIPLDGAGLQRRLALRAKPRGCSAKPLTLPARQPSQALSASPRPGATGALVGALLPVLHVAVIAAFNASYCLPIPGESPGPPNLNSGARYHEHLPLIPSHA